LGRTEEEIVYQEEVVLYAVARSRACRRARRLLRRKGYAFEEVDVGADEGLLVSLSAATGKKLLLPLVFLGGRLVGGLDEIQALEHSGDLDRLVRGRV
jgi:glutaredoxin 3